MKSFVFNAMLAAASATRVFLPAVELSVPYSGIVWAWVILEMGVRWIDDYTFPGHWFAK